jgi:hypothetical protein
MTPADRDEEMADLLDALHRQRAESGSIDPDALRQDHPALIDEALQLLEAERALETAADDWRRLAPAETTSIIAGNAETNLRSGAGDKTGADDEPIPKMLGRYQVVRRLGQGGMGSVYEAHDPQLNRRVAVKVPLFPGSPDRQSRARMRFLRESRAAATIEHPNVCQIYDAGEDNGRPYVVMAYVAGESLADRLLRGRFDDPRQAAILIAQTADALAAVHAHGIIHRDVKPGNILLSPERALTSSERKSAKPVAPQSSVGTAEFRPEGSANPTQSAEKAPAGSLVPKLTDFGLARSDDEGEQLTADGTLVGTPAYMAPEQASPEFGKISPRSDVYSLGAVLYEMLAGRRPYEGTVTQILAQISSRDVRSLHELRPDLDPALAAIVGKAMARQPQQRYPDAAAFAADLRRWLAGERVAAAAPGRAASAPSRRWLLIAGLAAAAAVVVLGVGLGAAALLGIGLFALRPGAPSPVQAEVSASGEPITAASGQARHLKGDINVVVWRRENRLADGSYSGQPLNLADPNVLPLRPDDGLQIRARLRAGSGYMYIVWLNTEGKVEPLFPWDENWKIDPARDVPRTSLDLPDQGAAPLGGGPAGIESLILLARDEKLPPDTDLKKLFAGLERQNGLELGAAVWLENGKVVHDELDRGAIKLKEATRVNDPVLRTQRVLQDKLQSLFPYSRAVCFSNAGDR